MTWQVRRSPLPYVASAEDYESISSDDARFEPAVRELALDLGMREQPQRYPTGTALAYRLGEAVLKLYPPPYASDAALEREVLLRAASDPDLPVPRVLAHGERDGWRYLLMTRLLGTPIEQSARALSSSAFCALMERVGGAVRRLHAVSAQGLPRTDAVWDSFRARCRLRAVSHHVQRGFAAERTKELADFLAQLDGDTTSDGGHVLLHTELGPGHVLVEGERLTGLFDFGEARQGPHAYDFAAVGLFLTRGDALAFRAFLDGYGVDPAQRGEGLVRCLMRHALLHPYGHLTFYFGRSPPPDERDLASAARYWFGH